MNLNIVATYFWTFAIFRTVAIQGVSVEMVQNATVNKGCQTEKIDIRDLVSKTSCYGVTGVSFRSLDGRQSTVLVDSSA